MSIIVEDALQNSSDFQLILREFYNHLYIGQWELAQACVLTLENDEDKHVLINALKSIIININNVSGASTKFSSDYLRWLCLSLLKKLEGNEFDKNDSSWIETELMVLFDDLVPECKAILSKELIKFRTPLYKGGSQSLSTGTCFKLNELIKQDPYQMTTLLKNFVGLDKDCTVIYQFYLATFSHFSKKIVYNKPTVSNSEFENSIKSAFCILSALPEEILSMDRLIPSVNHMLEDLIMISQFHGASRVYGALIARPTPRLLKMFCQKENELLGLDIPQALFETKGGLNFEQAALFTLKTGQNFLKVILEHFVQLLLEKKRVDALQYLSDCNLLSIFPLVLLQAWSSSKSSESDDYILQTFQSWCTRPETLHPVFKDFCYKAVYNISFIKWILDKLSYMQPEEFSHKVRNLFNQLQSQSPIRVLNSSLGLRTISLKDLKAVLSPEFIGLSEDTSPTTSMMLRTNKMLYISYIVLSSAMEAIHSSFLIEKISRSSGSYLPPKIFLKHIGIDQMANLEAIKTSLEDYGLQVTYDKYVLEKLDIVKRELKTLYPLTFRVEILENLFSLLFLTHNEYFEAQTNETDFEEDIESELNNSNNKNTNSSDHSPLNVPRRRLKSLTKQGSERGSKSHSKEEADVSKGKTNRTSSLNEVSSSSTSAGSASHTGFICNEFITRDLLICIKDLLHKAALALKMNSDKGTHLESPTVSITSSISEENMLHHINKLLSYVSQAHWRFELIVSPSVDKKYGRCSTFPHLSQYSNLFSTPPNVSRQDTLHKSLSDPMEYINDNNVPKPSYHASRVKRKKTKKRKRSTPKTDTLPQIPTSIIHHMLASPSQLIIYCLSRGNIDKAEQVIRLFQLENNHISQEVFFYKKFEDFKKHVQVINIDKVPVSIPDSKLNFVPEALANNIGKVKVIERIEESLHSLDIPSLPRFESDMCDPNFQDLFHELKDPKSLVLFDIAACSCPKLELSILLFSMISQQLKSVNTLSSVVLKRLGLSEYKGLIKTLIAYKELSEELKNEMRSIKEDMNTTLDCLRFGISNDSLFHILTFSLGSFSNKDITTKITLWKNFLKLFKDVENSLRDLNSEATQEMSQLSPNDDSSHPLHLHFKELIHACSNNSFQFQLNPTLPITRINYLNALFFHLKHNALALAHCRLHSKATGLLVHSNYFSIIHENPSDILKKMILNEGINPTELEHLAHNMRLNLVHILAQNFFPKIPVKNNVSGFHLPKTVINNSTKMWPLPDHPEIVSQNLITYILCRIMNVCDHSKKAGIFDLDAALFLVNNHRNLLTTWMEDCSQLGYVDLNLLVTRTQKISFFANVANIAWLHALFYEILFYIDKGMEASSLSKKLILTTSNMTQRLIHLSNTNYKIGQLKTISLFELRYLALHWELKPPTFFNNFAYKLLYDQGRARLEPFQTYFPPLEPRLFFILCDGFTSSPKLQVLHIDNMDYVLIEAMRSYLTFHVKADAASEQVLLPEKLEFYSQDFVFDDNSDLSKAEYEGLIVLVSDFLEGPMKDNLQTLLKMDSIHGFSENIDFTGKKELPFKIIFQQQNADFGFVIDYNKLEPQLPTLTPDTTVTIPHHVLDFLQKRNPLIYQLLQIMKDKSKLHLLKDSAMKRQLDHFQNLWNEEEQSDIWLATALRPHPSFPQLWHKLNTYIQDENWEIALKWIWLVEEHYGTHLAFQNVKDLILYNLCSEQDISLKPWLHILSIESPFIKVKCILKNLIKWPYKVCIEMINSGLTIDNPQLQNQLNEKLNHIKLYQEISKEIRHSQSLSECCEPVNIKTWQEVYEVSLSQPELILNCLSTSSLYKNAINWSRIHVYPAKCQGLVWKMHLLWHFDHSSSFEEIEELLISIPSEEIAPICQELISNLDNPSGKIYLVAFLMKNSQLAKVDEKYYFNLALGLKILSESSLKKKKEFEDFATKPYCLIEHLIMQQEVEQLERIFKMRLIENSEFETVQDLLYDEELDRLCEEYAAKALELPIRQSHEGSASNSPTLTSQDESYQMPQEVPSKENWVPDLEMKVCQCCQTQRFSMLSRRHHCRRCGRVVCGTCSQKTLQVENYSGQVRACDQCYAQTQLYRLEETIGSSPFRSRAMSIGKISSSPVIHSSLPGSVSGHSMLDVSTVSVDNSITSFKDFSFSQTPSPALCLSILRLHSNSECCRIFLMEQVIKLLQTIRHSQETGNKEVDYSLVLSMSRVLLLNTKVRYIKDGDHDSLNEVDLYLQHLSIMELLVNANCAHLIPKEEITYFKTISKLLEQLTKEERWDLALEISTKFNISTYSLWGSWGMVCLRAGHFKLARKKFDHILKAPADRSSPQQESPLLKEIISCLEMLDKPSKRKSTSTPKDYPGSLDAVTIHRSLQRLKLIKTGSYQNKFVPITWESTNLEESVHYLNNYGCHSTILSFHIRHTQIYQAVKFLMKGKSEMDNFMNEVFLPCLNNGVLQELLNQIHIHDPNLSMFHGSLLNACRYLDSNNSLNVLHKIQIFMKDYMRAAMTCIKFYGARVKCYSDYQAREHLLIDAQRFLKMELGQSSKSKKELSKATFIKSSDIPGYLKTIEIQVDYARALANFEKEDDLMFLHKRKHFPTLFGNFEDKLKLIEIIATNTPTIESGFVMIRGLVELLKLSWMMILTDIGKLLINLDRSDELGNLVECSKTHLNFKVPDCDTILLNCLELIGTKTDKIKDAEKIIKMIVGESNKIKACIMCGRLKSAYMLALKGDNVSELYQIMKTAKELGQNSIYNLCHTKLSNIGFKPNRNS